MSKTDNTSKVASYAEGGLVLGRTVDFMKKPDRFRDSQFKKATEDNFGKGEGTSYPLDPPADKCLTPVKPRS